MSACVPSPPAANSRRTQIATTTPTYRKATVALEAALCVPPSRTLDCGAGRGLGAAAIGADSLEPYPQPGIVPTFQSGAAIPSGLYGTIVCLNMLNVLYSATCAEIVTEILRILRLGGAAVIMTRGRDVLAASPSRRRSGASPLPAPASPPPAPKRWGRPGRGATRP